MEEKLYYEKANTTRPFEVEETYQYAVEQNYKYYRAKTEKGAYYGWENGKCVKAADGQEWFENHNYQEPENDIQPDISLNESTLEVTVTTKIQEFDNQIDNQIVNEDTTNYKALYEEAIEQLKQTQDAAGNYLKKYTQVKNELESIRAAFAVFVKEYEIAKELEV